MPIRILFLPTFPRKDEHTKKGKKNSGREWRRNIYNFRRPSPFFQSSLHCPSWKLVSETDLKVKTVRAGQQRTGKKMSHQQANSRQPDNLSSSSASSSSSFSIASLLSSDHHQQKAHPRSSVDLDHPHNSHFRRLGAMPAVLAQQHYHHRHHPYYPTAPSAYHHHQMAAGIKLEDAAGCCVPPPSSGPGLLMLANSGSSTGPTMTTGSSSSGSSSAVAAQSDSSASSGPVDPTSIDSADSGQSLSLSLSDTFQFNRVTSIA